MRPICAFRDVQSAANAVLDEIHDRHAVAQRLTARPYNPYEASNTTWWLIPSTEWPAYRFAKLFFDRRGDGLLYCGLHVEKGITPAVYAAAFGARKAKNQVLQADWAWHRISAAMKQGQLDLTVQAATASSGMSVRLIVEARIEQDQDRSASSPSDEEPALHLDTIEYDAGAGSLTATNAVLQAHLLDGIEQVTSLADLAQALQGVKLADWLWCDLYFSTALELSPASLDSAPAPAGAWDAAAIWDRCLAPWKSWIG
jgi:hypothetical protein